MRERRNTRGLWVTVAILLVVVLPVCYLLSLAPLDRLGDDYGLWEHDRCRVALELYFIPGSYLYNRGYVPQYVP